RAARRPHDARARERPPLPRVHGTAPAAEDAAAGHGVRLMLEKLLAADAGARACTSVAEWWRRHRDVACVYERTIDQAIAGGFHADRTGWAFASGYQAALRALFPGLPEDRICALCVTEADGNTPRAIRTTLRRAGSGWRLDGAKRWTTLGPEGALFLVAARDTEVSGERPALRIALVASNAHG